MSTALITAALFCALQSHSSPFATWVEGGFCAGAPGLFESNDKDNRSRFSALLEQTEFRDFDWVDVTASSDRKQLRFWSYWHDAVVILDRAGVRQLRDEPCDPALPPGALILNDSGERVAVRRLVNGEGYYVRDDGTFFKYERFIWVDDAGEFAVVGRYANGKDARRPDHYELFRTSRPAMPLATLTGHDSVDFVRRVGPNLFVCGRVFPEADDDDCRLSTPSGVCVEQFSVEGERVIRVAFREYPCPKVLGAQFAYIKDINESGQLIVGVDKRIPFTDPRAYFFIDPAKNTCERLNLNYRSRVLFLDQAAIAAVANELDKRTRTNAGH